MSSKKLKKIAIVGATGAVGRELISILESRRFPAQDVLFFASSRSDGKEIAFRGKSFRCQVLKPGCFDGVDVAFFDASDEVSKTWVPKAAEAGAWVVDNSSAFRMEGDVPLIVPEVNGNLLAEKLRNAARLTARERIIAGPNCSTVQMAVALQPLHERFGLERVVVSTYQSASGAGSAAMRELEEQTRAVLADGWVAPKAFQHGIAFNCIPQIGSFSKDSGGYTSEETKIIEETRKLLGLPKLRISATAVRVPTLSCHAESVNVELAKPVTIEQAREALRAHPGITVLDDPSRSLYPMGLPGRGSIVEGGTGRDSVYVGRIRKDFSVENGLNLWVVSDNLRKGAALNAVQIGEILALG